MLRNVTGTSAVRIASDRTNKEYTMTSVTKTVPYCYRTVMTYRPAPDILFPVSLQRYTRSVSYHDLGGCGKPPIADHGRDRPGDPPWPVRPFPHGEVL